MKKNKNKVTVKQSNNNNNNAVIIATVNVLYVSMATTTAGMHTDTDT